MKIVIAPDSYKESLSAEEVANAIEKGFLHVFPDANIVKIPLADGGEGTVDSFISAVGGSRIYQRVTGPLGNSIDSFFGVLANQTTAVIEMAAASGLKLIKSCDRNPWLTTTYGTGELVKAALDLGIRHIIVGLGGSATNDGGMGMLQALGVKFLDLDGIELKQGGGELGKLARIDLSNCDKRLKDTRFHVMCDVNSPLCGPLGASYFFGPQKGATQELVESLDNNLAHYAEIVFRTTGIEVRDAQGAGAAGGLGAAFLGILKQDLLPGVDVIMESVGFDKILTDSTLVITGEGCIDAQTIHGKAPVGVARAAKRHGIPVVVIAGSIGTGVESVYQHGIDAVYSVINSVCSIEDAYQFARYNTEFVAMNIAKTLTLSSLLPDSKRP
jgi:glycerate kinase